MKLSVEERFWAKVDKSGDCWQWTAYRNPKGYGKFGITHGTLYLAHRVSWWLAHGEFPSLCVLHRCDNPSCVRLDHLFLGTKADNNKDMKEKGRASGPKGETHRSTRLNKNAVADIKDSRRKGESVISIAARHGVSRSAVYDVLDAVTWKHIGLKPKLKD